MRWIAVLATLVLLSACGADGEPVQPTRNATITLSEAGVSAQTNVGMRKGPFNLSLGLGL